ncbi:protein rogdi [Scaptodrosophila lebanonensis]|uniref:Protein rogdi n=1 Tax=Drosophila lebanonensis TaxID=7225 RepID=A0A6J2TC33_DROLE|nr:protein rogdi [Scaptodrosophila lebanonensis]
MPQSSATNNWSFQSLPRQRSGQFMPHVHLLTTVPETAPLLTPPPIRKPLTLQLPNQFAGVAAAGNIGSQNRRRFITARRKAKATTTTTMKMLVDTEHEEARNLQIEFEWVLRMEVHAILKQLRTILVECAHRFPVPLYENEGKKTEKFILSVSPDQLKAVLTLTGDAITQADISFKLCKAPSQTQRTSITHDSPWKLQQVQDAANHLQTAINHIDDVDDSYHFKTSDEVLHVIGNILDALQRGRNSLLVPKKKPIDELIKGRNMKSLVPNLPEDLAVSFYLQSHKLIVAVYQLLNNQGTMRFDSRQAEASVQWLNDVLLLLMNGQKLCQQLKDKISVFSVYKDFTVGSRSPSALSY